MNHDRRGDPFSSVFGYTQLHSPNSNLTFANGCRGNLVDVQVPNRPLWPYENNPSASSSSTTTTVTLQNAWNDFWPNRPCDISNDNPTGASSKKPIARPVPNPIGSPSQNPIGSPVNNHGRNIRSNSNHSTRSNFVDSPTNQSNDTLMILPAGSPMNDPVGTPVTNPTNSPIHPPIGSPRNHHYMNSKNHSSGGRRNHPNGNQKNYYHDSQRNYVNDSERHCSNGNRRNYHVDRPRNNNCADYSNNPICAALTTVSHAFANAIINSSNDNVSPVSSSSNASNDFSTILAKNLANTLTGNWSKSWCGTSDTDRNSADNWPSSSGSSGRSSASSSTGSSGAELVRSPNGSSAESLAGSSGSNCDRNEYRSAGRSALRTSGRSIAASTSNHGADRHTENNTSHISPTEVISRLINPANYQTTGTTGSSCGNSDHSCCYAAYFSGNRSGRCYNGSPTGTYFGYKTLDEFKIENLVCRLVKRVHDEIFGHSMANGYNPYFISFVHNTLMDIFKLNASFTMPWTPILPASLYCDIHSNREKFFCNTCSATACPTCEYSNHQGHIIIRLRDILDFVGMEAHQVLTEAKIAICALREDLDNVQNAADTLEQKAKQVSADISVCIRKVASTLQSREKELLSKIEKAKLYKFASLKARDQGLRIGIARLSNAADKLGKVIQRTTITNNPLDLIMTKDMVSAEIFKIQHIRQNLPLPEENWISFSGIETNILQALASLGSIVVNHYGVIGDRRALRGPIRPQTSFLYQPPSLVRPLGSHGRPVHLAPYPITARVLDNTHLTTETLQIIGCNADGESELCRPWGVACDVDGHIIIADRSNNRILIYYADGSFIRGFGTQGTNFGEFDRPAGVAVDSRRRIIVADKDNHRIQLFTLTGIFLLGFGEKGNDCGYFNYPWDVAANSVCQIVVSDTRNHRVQLFSPEGIFLRKYGFEASPCMWKHFDSPRGVTFNPNGDIVTTDFNNHRIVVISSDFMSARILGNEATSSTRQFLRPQGLVIDDEGNIIVADSRNHRVQIFDRDGTLKWTFGSFGQGPNEMDRPSGIALCPDGKIAVVDFGNNRVLLI